MSYALTQLAADIREALKSSTGRGAKELVCKHVSKALADPSFIATHLQDRAPNANPREVLHEDPELGFCICGHVYGGPANGAPHDHGPSWAIYGQATGTTEMTDWKIVTKGEGDQPSLVEPTNTYLMKPGDAHLYDVGDVHSPKRDAPVKLIRIEGQNLDRVRRSNIKAK
jgi:predicted metal-dependent enzyme (double-stranded beta helix superfamily)